MLLSEIICNTVIISKENFKDVNIRMLAHDSRRVEPGALFFCINGTQIDGHDFATMAVEQGAVALVVEHVIEELKVPQIVVADTRSAMSVMSAQFYGNPANKLRLIGITGTNGKTSVTYMIKSIAEACGYRCGIIGTIGIYYGDKKENTDMTTPDPIELQAVLSRMVEHNMDWVIMEVSAHALDLRKLDGITFSVAAFTNLTQDHLDYFGDMENYYNAKECFFHKKLSHLGLVNADDSYGKRIAKSADIPVMAYGLEGNYPIHAENISLSATMSEFDLYVPHGAARVRLNVGGKFNIYNALTAAGCAMLAGASFKTVQMGLEAFNGVPGRFNVIDSGRGFSIVIDYAHTPDGLENVLNAAKAVASRVIPVFGCGGNRDKLKRPIMGEIAGRLGDFCVITSDNPRFEEPDDIIAQIEEGIKKTDCPYILMENRESAIKYAIDNAQKDDIIVIAGKGAEDYQDIKGVKHPFSDEEKVLKILKENA